jgi:hypothetical protein
MNNKFDINSLRIASPCPVGWETMKGDERKRFCDMCSLSVYNISEMTRNEAEAFIGKAEGRICARIYRRADGTVITRDCPVGLRAVRKRAARFAGGVFSTILGLFSIGYGQTAQEKRHTIVLAAELKTIKTAYNKGDTGLSGTVTDPAGAAVPDVAVIFTVDGFKDSVTTRTNGDGKFAFINLKPGKYTLEIEAKYGYKGALVKDLSLEKSTLTQLTIPVEVDVLTEVVGIIAEPDIMEIVPEKLIPLPISLPKVKKLPLQ